MNNTIRPIIFDLDAVNGAEQNFEKAMYWYEKGKELGDPRCAYGVSDCQAFSKL